MSGEEEKEEAAKEEVTKGEEPKAEEPSAEKREAPPEVIQIRAPPPFDEEALEPFVDVFMQKRGLTDRKQAAVKLANVLWKMGYDPRRDIQNVTTYINNLSTILGSIPDTDETRPVKGALLARGATDTAGMLTKAHFGGQNEMDEVKEIMRYGMRMNMTMRALDQAFKGGGETTSNPEVATLKEQVKTLQQKLEKGEEEKALDTKLNPIREQMNAMIHRLDSVATRPKTAEEESALSKEVKQMLDATNKRLDALDQRYQTSQEIQTIRNEISTLKTTLEKGGKPTDVTDVFDQAIKVIDKVNETVKKAGGIGAEGELDWRAAGISAVSEIATEAIGAYRDIATKTPLEEETQKAPAKTEKVSEQIVDRKLLSFLQQTLAQGATEFNSMQAAKAIGVTEDDILKSYERLKAKGILRNIGEESGGTKQASKKPAEQGQWVEG